MPGAFGGGLRGSGWEGRSGNVFFLGGEGEFESKIANVSEKNRKTYAKIGTHLNKTREQMNKRKNIGKPHGKKWVALHDTRKHTDGPLRPPGSKPDMFFFFGGLAPHAHSQRAGKFKM